MMRAFLLAILILGGVWGLDAQNPNIGIPFIDTYPKDIYQSGAQNKKIRQDDKGIMYFANNNGLMYFDGLIWKTFPLPNFTIVRSIEIAGDGSIYVGGQDEVGKFIPNSKGELVFKSLKNIIPENHRSFEDVWEITDIKDEVFFRASKKLYKISGKACKVYDGIGILFLAKADGKVMVHGENGNLYYLENEVYKIVEGSEQLHGTVVTEILETANHSIIATQNDGLFKLSQNKIEPWKTDADDFLKKNHIISGVRSPKGQLVFGTDFGGALIMDKNGESQFLLDNSNSLLNNKVVSTFFDRSQNLWLGVDNGINYIQINSPFSRIYPDGELEGTGFAAKIFKDKVYLGTNNGLYVSDWMTHYQPLNPVGFELVENTKGQNWGLDIVGGELLLGHNKGAFSIEGNKGTNIYSETGVWNFEKLKADPNYAIAGTYQNFSLFKNENGRWTHANDFGDWFESSRFVEEDEDGNIWVSHPYKGVFKIQLEDGFTKLKVKKYGAGTGLPSDISNHLFKIKNEIVYCGEKGIFLYNAKEDTFHPYERFNDIFGADKKIRRFFEAPNDDIWYVTENIGVIRIQDRGLDKQISQQVFPQFKNQLNPGYESIYPFDDKNVFITYDKGFIHYNPSFQNTVDSTFDVILNGVTLTNADSIIFSGHFNDSIQSSILASDQDAVQFNFSATDYVGKKYLHYRHFLDGYEKDWSDWSNLNFKEYTNLSPGKYTFQVQAENQRGITSSITTYSFEILAPWYASKVAFAIYGLLAFLLIGGIVRAYQKKYYGLKEDRDQTIKKSAEAIDKLKEEKIKAELEYKQRELTSATMHVVQKNETLVNIKEQLTALKKMNKDQLLSKEIQKMINMLQQDEVMDDGWDQFMLHFSQLHGDYYNRLKSKYSELTPKDLKLCTYLRMNLSTKEMASLLNVTTRGIEASRYRLRKKINLDKEENLTEFLMRF